MLALVACRGAPAEDAACTCTPGNASLIKGRGEAAPMDGEALLAKLRHHQQLVDQNTNPRAVKVFDDELRFAVGNFCQPCGDWVKDRMTIDDLFPMLRLGEARSAVCMGLVLRDGSTVYGDARPRACR
jgi:hypothetical protein